MALTENDYKLIGKLIDISTTIYKSYIKLRKLEEAGSYGSKEYEIEIENIKKLNLEEDKYYVELDKTREKILAISKYFFDKNVELTFGRILSVAESRNMQKLVQVRILLKMRDSANNYVVNYYSNEILKFLFIPDYENNNGLLQLLANAALDKDYFNTIFAIVNKSLENKKYENISNQLSVLKYNLSFLWPSIEQNNITYKFNEIPLYWGAQMYSDIFNGSKEIDGLNTIVDMCQFFLELLLNDLFGKNQSRMTDSEIAFALIYLRAGLMFAPREVLEKFKKRFELTVVNNSMKNGNLSIENDILEILDLYSDDKKTPRLVRFSNNGLCAKK